MSTSGNSRNAPCFARSFSDIAPGDPTLTKMSSEFQVTQRPQLPTANCQLPTLSSPSLIGRRRQPRRLHVIRERKHDRRRGITCQDSSHAEVRTERFVDV